MYTPYVRFANPQTQMDPSAKNVVGSIYSPPPGTYTNYTSGPTFSPTLNLSTPGYGAPGVFKYVYFYDASALTGTMQAAPAPVYWTDESFTAVTGHAADAYSSAAASVAGYLMPNATALGTSNTGAQWYLQLSQSYVWIQIGGFLSQAYAPTTQTAAGIGNSIYYSTGADWASTVNTTLAASSRLLGVQYSAIVNSLCDVMVGNNSTFWGS